MTEKDEDELEIFEARKALAAANSAEIQVNAVAASAARASAGIRTIVQKNGYVERFRTLIREAS